MSKEILTDRLLEAVSEVYMVPSYMESRVHKAIREVIEKESHSEAATSRDSINNCSDLNMKDQKLQDPVTVLFDSWADSKGENPAADSAWADLTIATEPLCYSRQSVIEDAAIALAAAAEEEAFRAGVQYAIRFIMQRFEKREENE